MTEKDWYDEALHVVGMFVSGDPLRSPGPRGEQQHDRSFVLWLNAEDTDCPVRLPENEWVASGDVVLSTDPKVAAGTRVEAGGVVTLGARSLLLMRSD
jgi:glycogen operon protein